MYVHIEVLGVQLLHIEWGRGTPSESSYQDCQYPMTIGFRQPDRPDEVVLHGRHETDARRADAAARRH